MVEELPIHTGSAAAARCTNVSGVSPSELDQALTHLLESCRSADQASYLVCSRDPITDERHILRIVTLGRALPSWILGHRLETGSKMSHRISAPDLSFFDGVNSGLVDLWVFPAEARPIMTNEKIEVGLDGLSAQYGLSSRCRFLDQRKDHRAGEHGIAPPLYDAKG